MSITLGELIKNKRNELGLTIIEAAKRVDVSKMTFVRLEKDETENIRFHNIVNVANNLNIDFFRILQANKKVLLNFEFESALKTVKRFYYKGELLQNSKLEQLIEENMDDLKSAV